ncbi:hypothetical protein DVA43_11870 [Leclercia sp. W6]|nr:hypothetical protein DVA43_11870 [Leclercia sp. W6]
MMPGGAALTGPTVRAGVGFVPCGLMPGGAALTRPTVRAGVGFVGRVRRSRHPAHSTALNRGNLLPKPA